MAVFGVDFGNLNSTVSTARRGGIDIIINEVSKRETTSMVSFGDKERFLGEKALDQALRNWKNTIGNLKRLIGVKYDTDAFRHEKQFCKNQCRPDENGFVEILVRYKFEEQWFKPEQLCAMLFTQLRSYAELEAATDAKVAPGSIKVVDCVVSTPAYYTVTQRKLLHQALVVAGCNPLTLINETTAAALDWGIFKNSTLPEKEEEAVVIAIVDVGHSALTVTIVSYLKGQLKTLGHVYDVCLGCRDFDQLLYKHFAEIVMKKYHIDLAEEKKNAIRLMSGIDKLRKMLSSIPASPLNVEMGDVDCQFGTFSREEAEALWAPLLEQTKNTMKKALTLPGADKVTQVEIIGGGSRIPAVQAAVSEAFGLPVGRTLNASETVAKGCGIMGAMLSPKFKVREFSVIDSHVHTVNLGYHSEKSTSAPDKNFPQINKKMVVLKPGDACPKTLNLTFDRSQDFELYVFYDEANDVVNTNGDLLVGKWRVSGIPTLADQPSVKVRLRLSPSMLIGVEGATVTEEWEEEEVVEPKKEEKKEEKKDGEPMATDEAEGEKAEPEKQVIKKKKTKKHECVITCLQQVGHADATIKEFTDLEASMVRSDENVRQTLEMKNTLESYIFDMRSKCSESGEYGKYIDDKDRAELNKLSDAAQDWLYEDGEDAAKDDYELKYSELKKIANPAVLRCTSRKEVPKAMDNLKAEAVRVKTLAGDPKCAHIPAEELENVKNKADDILAWAQAEEATSAALPLTSMPSLTAELLALKQMELTTFANPILTKPVPKAPTPPPASPTTPAEPAAPTEEAPKADAPAEGEPAPAAENGVENPAPAADKMDMD